MQLPVLFNTLFGIENNLCKLLFSLENLKLADVKFVITYVAAFCSLHITSVAVCIGDENFL